MIEPLQICEPSGWITGDWHSCVFNPLVAATGEGLFGVIVGGSAWLALYFAGNGRMETPTAVIILAAPLLFAVLPGGMGELAYGVITVGIAAAFLQGLQKYVLNPSTT
jgi:uncharacterized membrane protein YedE/YeeE